jgi:hypothetical protein
MPRPPEDPFAEETQQTRRGRYTCALVQGLPERRGCHTDPEDLGACLVAAQGERRWRCRDAACGLRYWHQANVRACERGHGYVSSASYDEDAEGV